MWCGNDREQGRWRAENDNTSVHEMRYQKAHLSLRWCANSSDFLSEIAAYALCKEIPLQFPLPDLDTYTLSLFPVHGISSSVLGPLRDSFIRNKKRHTPVAI